MIRSLAFAAALLAAAAPAVQAHAGKPARPGPASPRSVIDRCGSGPESEVGGLRECIDRATGVQDRRLNRAYRAALARLKPARQRSLRVEQRAWLRERDDCPFSRENDGADFVYLVAECVHDHTRDRADALERYPSR
jgi:uncharacterized protein YecT (DUF1311 family)